VLKKAATIPLRRHKGDFPHVFELSNEENPKKSEEVKVEVIAKRTKMTKPLAKILRIITDARKSLHIAPLEGFKEVWHQNSSSCISSQPDQQVEIYKKYWTDLGWIIHDSKEGLNVKTTAKYLHGIMDGIASFHSSMYIHGDVKPDNVAVTASGVVKIIDFESVKGFDYEYSSSHCSSRYRMNFPGHIAEIDLWAIGCILFEMLTKVPLSSLEGNPVERGEAAIARLQRDFPDYSEDIGSLLSKLLFPGKLTDETAMNYLISLLSQPFLSIRSGKSAKCLAGPGKVC